MPAVIDIQKLAAASEPGASTAEGFPLAMAAHYDPGVLTLTRGMGLRVLYYAPLVGVFFGLYEYFRAMPLLQLPV